MIRRPNELVYGTLALVAAGMLFWALGRHSYDYFTFLRVVVCAVSAFGSYLAFKRQSAVWGFGLVTLAALFNPFFNVAFKRQTWEKVDVAAGAVLIASAAFAFYASVKEARRESAGKSAAD
jgi:hypothetical protein